MTRTEPKIQVFYRAQYYFYSHRSDGLVVLTFRP